ncbi:MAG TPA: caspase family protein [Longimicrobiales bacterium]|nr:caspase family protein [Longimicrobiales bacterium]
MTLICDTTNARSAHALVIGIGAYPWLIGGDQPTFAQHGGMDQLTSAPASARAFASWFLTEFSHPELTDRTLDLLLADAAADTFDGGNGPVQVERATMANVRQAVHRWVARGDADEDSLLLFFFCGHGLGKGKQTVLLMEDFGSLPGPQSLTVAMDFDGFLMGMDQCAARRQCYFVDACRVGTPFALNTLNYFGDPVMVPAAKISNRVRSAPVFYSAVPGTAAYGRKEQPSFFTASLLNAFKGAGADDNTGTWRVETDILHRGIRVHLKRAVGNTAASGQLSLTDGLADSFALHELKVDPVVPVEVTCNPDMYNSTAQLSVSGGAAPLQLPAVPTGSWQLDLALGTYRFEVALPAPAGAVAPIDRPVRPPQQRIEVHVP